MSNKKKLLIYAHYYIPDTASTGQILRELAEGMLDLHYQQHSGRNYAGLPAGASAHSYKKPERECLNWQGVPPYILHAESQIFEKVIMA